MDTYSKEKRSDIMSRIRSRDTKPERYVKKQLWAKGFRYARRSYNLPGTPDVILPKHKVVIFVHGCFWHGHSCKRAKLPATNLEFWRAKVEANRRRDLRAMRALRRLGWHCYQIWQCRMEPDLLRVLGRLNSL